MRGRFQFFFRERRDFQPFFDMTTPNWRKTQTPVESRAVWPHLLPSLPLLPLHSEGRCSALSNSWKQLKQLLQLKKTCIFFAVLHIFATCPKLSLRSPESVNLNHFDMFKHVSNVSRPASDHSGHFPKNVIFDKKMSISCEVVFSFWPEFSPYGDRFSI